MTRPPEFRPSSNDPERPRLIARAIIREMEEVGRERLSPASPYSFDPLPLRDVCTVRQAELEDQARYVNEYPFANILTEKRRFRLNYTLVFCVVIFLLEVAGALYGAGCFDRFLAGMR